jgi:hypothetical protein
MECVENGQLQLLRRANHELEHFFEHSSPAVAGTQEELEALLQVERVLCAVGATLEDVAQNISDGEMREELAAYQRSLLRLQQELGAMQTSATSCRARLFMRQQNLHAARAWCEVASAVR